MNCFDIFYNDICCNAIRTVLYMFTHFTVSTVLTVCMRLCGVCTLKCMDMIFMLREWHSWWLWYKYSTLPCFWQVEALARPNILVRWQGYHPTQKYTDQMARNILVYYHLTSIFLTWPIYWSEYAFPLSSGILSSDSETYRQRKI